MAFYLGEEHGFIRGESRASSQDIKRIRSELMLTGEFGSEVQYWMDNVHPFRVSKPVSEEDSEKGQICTASKMWFPASRIVYVGGLPYGDKFAPKGPKVL
jgi:hypothetical protein